MPCISTINRWISKLDVEPGVLGTVINLLKCKAETTEEYERICIMSFDECSVCMEWSYDKATDTLYKPKRKVQCVMIRGMVGAWKQLIYYDFDTNMTKKILFELILKVENAGYPVVAIVSDLGPSNISLWNKLGIGWDKSSFTNPANSEREVYVSADAPHLIKLIRKNFIDHGYQLSDQKYALSGCVRELVQRSTSDLKVAHKLSEKNFLIEGVNRMNVKLAVQLMSETTAKALNFFRK